MSITLKGVSSTNPTQSTPVQQIGSMDHRPVVQIDTSVAKQGFKAGASFQLLDDFCAAWTAMAAGFGLGIGTIFATAAVGITTRNPMKTLATFGAGLLLTATVVIGLAQNKICK